jgi:tol-pal system protein YbgF
MAMKRFIQAYKTRLLLTAGALFVVCAATSAPAQTASETSQLLNRLNQLENQVQTMSRAVFKGERRSPPPQTSPGEAAPATAAGYEVRLSQIEDQQRALTGQLEKINFELEKLKASMTRLQADTEQRFQQGGQGANTAPTPLTPASTAAPAEQQGGGTLGALSSSEGNNGPAEALYEDSFSALKDDKYDRAESGFKDFLSQYPGHPLASNAQYWLGETYYVRGDYKQAAKMFAQGYQNFPKSAKANDSLLKLGLSLSKMGKKDDACISLKQLQKEIADAENPLRHRATEEIKQLGCP